MDSTDDWFHGTYAAAAEAILTAGFGKELHFEDGSYWQMKDGHLGAGTYITRDPALAAWYGSRVLRVRLQAGSRLIDVDPPADRRVIDSLRREFSQDLLTTVTLHKVIPANKKLTTRELIELLRYRYHATWDHSDKPGFRWDRKRTNHSKASLALASMLKRYGFAGFGEPTDENGLLTFAPDRLTALEVVEEWSIQSPGAL